MALPREQVQTYRHVSMASHPGCAHYEARPELLAALEPAFVLDPDDLATARLLLANPEMSVLGPNDALTDGVLHRSMRMEAQQTMRTHAHELDQFLKARGIHYVRFAANCARQDDCGWSPGMDFDWSRSSRKPV